MRRLTALLLALCLGGCTSVFFQPDRTLFQTPGLYGLDYQPVELHAADGTELFAWFLPARGKAQGTVL
ncbi:MAG TPA: alpha/beta hydrolase, partial [Burkholderiales bacterium]|nr:alpha/beta hydrolase [Burkholderiales bacterium]